MKKIGTFVWLLGGLTVVHADTLTNTVVTLSPQISPTTGQVLASSQFWVCTVIATIVLSLFNHWFNPKFFEKTASLSKRWATRNEKLKHEREERIKQLINNPHEQQFFLSLVLDRKLSAIFSLVNSVLCCMFTLYLITEQKTVHSEIAKIVSSIGIAVTLLSFCTNFLVAIKLIRESLSFSSEINEGRERTTKELEQTQKTRN